MPLLSLGSFSDGRSDDYVVVETDLVRILITQTEKGDFLDVDPAKTESNIKTELVRRSSIDGRSEITENLFVHVNRGGKRVGEIALAWGVEPDVWPEDDPEE